MTVGNETATESESDLFSVGMFNKDRVPQKRVGDQSVWLVRFDGRERVQHLGQGGSQVGVLEPMGRAHEDNDESEKLLSGVVVLLQKGRCEPIQEQDRIGYVGHAEFRDVGQHLDALAGQRESQGGCQGNVQSHRAQPPGCGHHQVQVQLQRFRLQQCGLQQETFIIRIIIYKS